MSDIIPPILSSTPPPLADIADDDDDFGDFAVADDPFHTSDDIEPGKDEPWNEECLKKNVDNTSQDSVLSGNTDSGLCSDSSPLPGLDSNCDHQAEANCDVPLSSIIKAQCDLPKTSTNSEKNHIPRDDKESSVNCKNNSDELDISKLCFNGNNLEQISCEQLGTQQSLQNSETKNVKQPVTPEEEEEDNGNFDVGDLEDLKPEEKSNIELTLSDLNEQSLNEANSCFSKEAAREESVIIGDQDLDLDFADLEEANFEEQTIIFQSSQIPADTEIVDSSPSVDKDQNNELDQSQIMSLDDVQNICDERVDPREDATSTLADEPPPIPQDLDFDFANKDEDTSESFGFPDASSSKEDETTESFGFLDESPSSQITDEKAFNQMESIEINSAAEAVKEENVHEEEDHKAVEFPAFDEVAEFGAFDNAFPPSEDDNWALPESQVVEVSNLADDDFGDFEEADDDFGQFEESAQDEAPTSSFESEVKKHDLFSQPEKLQEMVESIFECDSPLGSPKALTALSSHLKHLWPEVQDVQNTPALEFQWNNSRSHDLLLSSLGIDTRNILYGHQWNSSMPRFAANLGHSPLEPLKAAEVTPSSSNPLVCEQDSVPAAQFDWNGSGLVNPLDSTLMLNIDLLWEAPSEQSAVKKVLSKAAQKVLSSLPDLSYMREGSLSRTQQV